MYDNKLIDMDEKNFCFRLCLVLIGAMFLLSFWVSGRGFSSSCFSGIGTGNGIHLAILIVLFKSISVLLMGSSNSRISKGCQGEISFLQPDFSSGTCIILLSQKILCTFTI